MMAMFARILLPLVLVLGCIAPANAQVTVDYIHTDQLGTPVAVTDANRVVIERREHLPFGELLAMQLRAGPDFTGHVLDSDTALVYMQQRYFDPEIGQFLSVDPIATDTTTGGNFNRYWYANNNPYRYVDPHGLQAFGSADPAKDYERTGDGGLFAMLLCGCNVYYTAPSGSGELQGMITPIETGLASGLTRGGAALGQAISLRVALSAGRTASAEMTTLFRAVSPAEMADLAASGGAFRNPLGIEVKYFSTTAEGARSYAQQTVGTALYEGPYTIVQTSIPTNSITPIMRASVDRGIDTITVPSELLPTLRPAATVP